MRTNTFHYYVQVELAHSSGRVAPPRRVQELIHETFKEMVEKGEHYGFGADDLHSPGTGYTIVESKVCAVDTSIARRLVGPAIVGSVDLLAADNWALTDPEPVELPEPAPVVEEVDILPRGRYVPDPDWTPTPAKKGWRTLEPPKDPYRFGDVVEVSITEPGRKRFEGKLRPCVWVAVDEVRNWHAVAKMTTLDAFEEGHKRQPLSWTGGVYSRGSHLWGDRLTWVPERAIEKLLGHLNDDDLATVTNTYRSELRPLGIDVD